jgi:hypothetical protein
MVMVLAHQEYITRAGRVAQVVECLLSKYEALSSNSSIALKKKRIHNKYKHICTPNPAPDIFKKTNRSKGRKTYLAIKCCDEIFLFQ